MTLSKLYETICQRRDEASPDQSYTARLISQGEDEILKKIGEESVELILAAKGQGDQRLIEEVADLTYHVLVLMASHQLTPDHIQVELERRIR
jgi:phosphoribosyl-ATP pyrophosphohydrolase